MDWKQEIDGLYKLLKVEVFGAGFRKNGVIVSNHQNLITFDGESIYFFGISREEAEKLLDEVQLLNGKIGWLAYMLQEVFYNDLIGDELYYALFDALYGGTLTGPEELSKDAIYQWLDIVASEVEVITNYLLSNL